MPSDTERTFHFWPRNDTGDITVSKTDKLPDGEFHIDEYIWGDVTLWFIREQDFTEAERQAAYDGWLCHISRLN